jgi:hypothetical protein
VLRADGEGVDSMKERRVLQRSIRGPSEVVIFLSSFQFLVSTLLSGARP